MGHKAEQTKRHLAATLAAMLEDLPLGKVSVSELVRRAGTNRQTFYYHFRSIDDLAVYLFSSRLALVSHEVARCRNAHELFSVVLDRVAADKDILAQILRGVGRPPLRAFFYCDVQAILREQAERMLADAVRDGAAAPKQRALDFALEYCQMASVSLVIDWLEGSLVLDSACLADRLACSFEQQIKGLLAA